MDIFAKLGIDWRLLIAQAVNFAILLFVLHRFAYKPMLAFLAERTERIEKGLQDAEAATVKLASLEEKEKEVLKAAREEARALIAKTEESAKKRDAERQKETEAKIATLLIEAEGKIQEERAKSMRDAKEELGSLVLAAVEKVIKEKMDPEKEKALIEKVLG
ncbi:MAG: F0F1 ATP synthase subunit B [Patescibacteria group bacterium]